MPTPLKLEYVLTDVELKKAQSLQLREHYTGKSGWRSWAILLGIMAAFLCLCYFRIRDQVAPKYQPWFLLGVAGFLLLLHFGIRDSGRKNKQTIRLEISELELIFTDSTGRTASLWSAFAECLESAELFVLVNRAKTVIYAIPKRAFPDAASQDWFRALANQSLAAPNPAATHSIAPPNLPENGLALQFQLRFSDYLIRNLSSWRVKGVALLMCGVIGFSTLKEYLHPDPQAVHGPGTVLLITLPIITGILVTVLFAVSFFWWRLEQKQNRAAHQLVLSDEGITFVNQNESGLVKWDRYENYLENRWCFLIWNRKDATCFLFPKRMFTTETEQSRCRELLQAHLQPSRWFFL